MLLIFRSSETGDMLMHGDTASLLLNRIGKTTQADGVITADEMAKAIADLKAWLAEPGTQRVTDDGNDPPSPAQSARIWPFLDMLERTAASKRPDRHILWHRLRS